MRIGVIGAGSLGTALARRLIGAGHDVRRSRHPGEVDVLVLAVRPTAVAGVLHGADPRPGTIIWSCVGAARGAVAAAGSVAEQVARCAPRARVVAAIPPPAEALGRGELLYESDLRPSVFVCADDDQAKAVVETLVFDLGAHPVDAGPLAAARLVEPAMLLLAGIAAAGPPRDVALRLLERT